MLNRISRFFLSPQTSLIMLGLMVSLPFISYYHRLPIPSFRGEWLAGVLGIVALLPMLRRASWQPLEIPQIALVFPGFLAILFMQWMLGMLHSTQYALLVASYLAWAFWLVILGNYLRRELGWEKVVTVLAWFLLAGGFVNVVFVLLQYAAKVGVAMPFMPGFQGYGAVGQVNHFADYMALAIASLIYLFAGRRLHGAIFVIGALAFLAMLAFSGSRSTWLYLVAFVILGFLLRSMAIRQQTSSSQLQVQQSRTVFRLLLLAIPAFALVQGLMYLLPDSLVTLPAERLMNESVAVSGFAIRWHVWQESLQLFLQSPWLGIGAGQMRWSSFAFVNPEAVQGMPGMFEHAHNLFIHVLTEFGMGGALLLLAGIVAWLRGFQWRHITLETWWLLALLAVIFIHGMLEYPLWYAYFLGIAAVLLGAGEEKTTQVRLPFVGRAAVVAVFIFGFAVLGSMAIANGKLEYWIQRARAGKIPAAEKPAMYSALEWVDEKSLLSPYAILLFATTLKPDGQRLDDKIHLSRSAMRFIVMRNTAYKHVLLLKLNGDHDGAVLQLRRALNAYPAHFTGELQKMPFEHWPLYLEVLSEAAPEKSR
ncbi:hypothetical protein MTYP_00408 [Methylophilaceae bacterium]|nr:hypothetical protein MTYP_00408 [Methylophilaceae bacterium]